MSALELSPSGMKAIQLEGLPSWRSLVMRCELERSPIWSSLKKLEVLEVSWCSKLVEIQFTGSVLESLKRLAIYGGESLEWLGSLLELQPSSESTACGLRIFHLSTVLKNPKEKFSECQRLPSIQVVSKLESLEKFPLYRCHSVERSVDNCQKLKSLRHIKINQCYRALIS